MIRNAFAFTLLCGALAAAFPAQAEAPAATPAAIAAKAPAAALAALAERYYQAQSHFDPVNATINGDNAFDSEMTNNLTPGMRARQFAMLHETQAELMHIDRNKLSVEDKVSFDCLNYEITSYLAFEPFKDNLLPMSQMDSVPVLVANFGSGQGPQPLNSVAQYHAYLKRIALLPQWIDAAIANMRTGMKEGIVQPRALIVSLLPQVKALADTPLEKSAFYAPIRNMPASFEKFDRDQLTFEYKGVVNFKVIPAAKRLADFLEKEYLPATRSSAGWGALPDGQRWYRAWVHFQTTSDLSPDEIHRMGLAEMERIRGEFIKLAPKLGYKGDPAGIGRWLAAQDKYRPFKTEDDVVNAYKALNAKIIPKLPQLFGTLPKAQLAILPEPPLSRDTASDHYTAGAGDGSRPGTFYPVITDASKYATTRMVSLFLHEGQPGHHFQISRQLEMKAPNFRRYSAQNAYIEGWALYAETLGKEMGLYADDPDAYAGYLLADMKRAARLVVDTGLHAMGWTREQTIQFLVEKAGDTPEAAANATERYMAWPGQALGYKIGALKIMELRQRAEAALGPKFSLAKFHDAVLADGPVPLSLLDSKINDWIAAQSR